LDGGTTRKVIQELDAVDVCQVDDGLIFRVIDLGSSESSDASCLRFGERARREGEKRERGRVARWRKW
jgi:hypothetical protein